MRPMKSIKSAAALKLIEKSLGDAFESIRDGIHILDIDETGIKGRIYPDVGQLRNCWVVYVPNEEQTHCLHPSHIICIDKISGRVIYDGSECGKKHRRLNILKAGRISRDQVACQ